jgi:hypothetical protein
MKICDFLIILLLKDEYKKLVYEHLIFNIGYPSVETTTKVRSPEYERLFARVARWVVDLSDKNLLSGLHLMNKKLAWVTKNVTQS